MLHQRRNPVFARARARRRAEGAAMFIVAITLALLAAMGVYGLAATAYDVRAAGQSRAAAQAQHAADVGIQTAAYAANVNAAGLYNQLVPVGGTGTVTMKCLTAKPVLPGDSDLNRVANACVEANSATLKSWTGSTIWPSVDAPAPTPFMKDSFGPVPDYANMRVEFTNPIDMPAGSGYDSGMVFTAVRVSVRVEMRPVDSGNNNLPADTVAMGRGRILIGPHAQNNH